MRHKRIMSIGLAALMLVSLCAACATRSVAAATNSGGAQASSQAKLTDVVGAPPGGLYSAPAACSWGPGRLDVFARGGNDGALWHTWWDGVWHSWESLGMITGDLHDHRLYSSPTAVSWGSGRIDVFVTGDFGTFWHKWFDIRSNGWHDWEDLGTPSIWYIMRPAACSWGANRLDVFAEASDGQLWQKWFNGAGGWQPWVPLGRPSSTYIEGSPGAVSTTSWGYPRVDVFVRGGDGALWQLWFNGAWQPWHRFDDTAALLAKDPVTASGGNTELFNEYYAPAACSWGVNRLDVFFAEKSGHLQQKWFNGNWQPLYQPGSSKFFMAASPSAVTWQLGGTTRIDIFTCDKTYALFQLYWAGASGWLGWYNLGAV